MHYYCNIFMWMSFLKSVLLKIEVNYNAFETKEMLYFQKIYLFLCLKVIFDTLGSFWSKNSSDFGKVQFCPELSDFSRFYPILATGEDFSTIVRLFLQTLVRRYQYWKSLHRISCKYVWNIIFVVTVLFARITLVL